MKHCRSANAMFALTLIAMSTSIAAAQETLLWSFDTTDGSGPQGGLIPDALGNLYGTTSGGGAYFHGTVYELSPGPGGTWSETVLYSFGENGGNTDGRYPIDDLVFDSKGNLYGVTGEGGENGDGTVFELMPEKNGGWQEKVLFSFSSKNGGGFNPEGGVAIDKEGNLYGTLYGGGASNAGGEIYKVAPGAGGQWTPSLVYEFKGHNAGDGSQPQGILIWDKAGNLYGTTILGGNSAKCGCGTVFEMTPESGGTWSEKVLYSFNAGPGDGSQPRGSLIFDAAGNLYGATDSGGTGNFGTLYELSPAAGGWTEKVLHSFTRPDDGIVPVDSPVFDPVGNLYAVTSSGGAEDDGAVIRLKPTPGGGWIESIVHSFERGESDGNTPEAGLLVDAGGNLFGTTSGGGADDYGAVFEIDSPAAAPTPVFSRGTGTYKSAVMIKITDQVSDATIYYTADGKVPTTESRKYTEPIKVSKNETITAIAVAKGYTESKVGTATYSIQAATPELSLAGGKYTKPQMVTITDSTAGVEIYFTTDGTAPTAASKRYITPIRVASTKTIKAIAIGADYAPSAIASATYTIELPAATPVISPDGGMFSKAQTVKITDATTGATIYYTTNGAPPTATSKKYTGSFTVSSSATVEAIAIAAGHTPSAVASAKFTIN